MRIPVLVLLGAAIFATPAEADWLYTKWGMTKAQIIAASKGEAREYRTGDDIVCAFTYLKIMAVVPRKIISGIPFNVSFCTPGDGRLSSVSLDSTGANIFEIKRMMLSQYGRAVSDSRGEAIWNDRRTGNTVTLIDIAGIGVRIEYKALGGSGL